ncbi:O-antigen ligase family protein [Alteromonas sp. KUL49]|uniref:O-antigen ligase family protein n=1 Tax=Alteromonas sp. KUL49 TaxID=2480798 RepID=UPI00102F09D2|nr:O-antigen ligase family protein [Alteromonas sp. KUL49]TAP40329.1 hypothetical protein EYS00_09205 [Alteromonas sp. KUL49]
MSLMLIRKDEFLSNLIGKYYPLLWYTGFHIVLSPLAACFVYLRYRDRDRSPETFIYFVFFLYMFIRAIASLISGDAGRAIATFYNFLVLFSGFLLFQTIKGSDKFSLQIIKSFANLFLFTVISYQLIYMFVLVSGEYYLYHKSLLGIIFQNAELPGLLDAAKTAIYTRFEWGFGDVVPRMVFLAEFPTTSALILSLTYAFFILYKFKKLSFFQLLMIDFIVLVSLTYTQSRVMLLAFLLSLLLSYLLILHRNNKVRAFLYGAFPFLIVMIGLGVFYLTDYLSSFRASSANVRFLSYMMGIELVLDSNPWFGLGVKPRVDSLIDIPIGSHSTLISSLVKFGIIGALFSTILFFIFPIKHVLLKVFNHNIPTEYRVFSVRVLPVILLWMVFQDLDAYTIASLLIFSCFGILSTGNKVK